MNFSSPLVSEPVRDKNRRMGRVLLFVVLGLFVFSICYILIAN